MPVRIFINYRREDAPDSAGWLAEHLGRYFEGQVFFDTADIRLGANYRKAMDAALQSADVLVAVIGPQWLTVTDTAGVRRLDDPDDPVRYEIEQALRLEKSVVPVLVRGATMPTPRQLPESLANFHFSNGKPLSPARFAADVQELAGEVRDMLQAAENRRAADAARASQPAETGALPPACQGALQEMLHALLPDPGPRAPVTDQHVRLIHSCWRRPDLDTDPRYGCLRMWQIHVMLAATPAVLSRIERVEYWLDPTYPVNDRESTDAAKNFGFYELANGHSEIAAIVHVRGQAAPVRLTRFIGMSEKGPKLKPLFIQTPPPP